MEVNFITKYIPKKALDKIESALRVVAGQPGEKSVFQKAYDFFKGITPNKKLVDAILSIAKYVLKIPNITATLLSAYQKASEYQYMIDADKMKPEDAGEKLKAQLEGDLGSSKLVDFIFGAVMIALKILQNK